MAGADLSGVTSVGKRSGASALSPLTFNVPSSMFGQIQPPARKPAPVQASEIILYSPGSSK